MKPITQFTKQNLPDVRKAIDAALNEVAEQFGLGSIEIANITFDREGTNFRTQLTAKVKAENNKALLAKQLNDSRALGYDKNIVGQTFTRKDGRSYTVTGIDLKKPKYPIIATETGSGAGFKFENSHKLNFEDTTIAWDKPMPFFIS